MAQAESTHNLSFFDHLDEMRIRIMRCFVVFMIGFIACFLVATDPVMEFLREPLFRALPPEQHKLYFTQLFENFLTHLKIAGYCSLFFFSPYYFYQLWAFIAPGLLEKERKFVVPFVVSATLFFVGGAAFSYYVLFPIGFKFFVTFGLDTDVPLLTIDSYYSTCLKLMLLFGLAFELPVLICFLGWLGVIDARFLRENRRQAIIGITVVSAFTAPPDAVSMLMLMAPLILMFEGAILVVQWLGVKRAAHFVAQEQGGVPPEDDDEDPLSGQSR